MYDRRSLLGLVGLALVACQHDRVAFPPYALPGAVPVHAQVEPYLSALTERWETWGASGEVSVGEVLLRGERRTHPPRWGRTGWR